MRTKTLLLTAALSAAGVATSMAQVYSVNAVGYVNTTLAPAFNLISNPLDAADNTIAALFSGMPDGTQVYKFENGTYTIATYNDLIQEWEPASAATVTVNPGEGVFVRNPTTGNLTVTFVGEVPQGTLANPVPAGFSIESSMVPQAGTVTELGYVPQDGDQVFKFAVARQGYDVSTYNELILDWEPALQTIGVGEAFFLRRTTAGTWTREFSVNE